MVIKILLIFINMAFVTSNCPAGATAADLNNPHELRYKITDEPLTFLIKGLLGPITEDAYHYGMTNTNGTLDTYIIRFSNPNNTIQWSVYFDNLPLTESSFCVDSAETFLYGIKKQSGTSYFSLYSFHTQNGTVAIAKQISNGTCGNDFKCSLTISSDNVLFGATEHSQSQEVFIFRYSIDTDTSVSYVQLGDKNYRFSLQWIYDSNVFFMNPSSGRNSIVLANINMSSLSYTWFREVTCAQIDTCDLTLDFYSQSAYNKEDSILYLNFVENNKLYFYRLNETDSQSSKVYIADDFQLIDGTYLLDSQTLFTCARSIVDDSFHIFVYNVSNSNFTEYTYTDGNIRIMDIYYNSVNSRLFLFGRYTLGYTYSVDTLVSTITDVDDISLLSTVSFNEANFTHYQPNLVSIGNPNNGSESISNLSTSLTMSTRTMNITKDEHASDVIYNFDTPTSSEYSSLVEGWNKTLPISITCSLDGNTSLEHAIDNYENYTTPTWVTLDETNYQLNLSIPEVIENTEYHFRIRTNEVGSSINYFKAVKLTVLNCGVSNCDKCQIDDTTSCYTCSSGYQLNGSNCVELVTEETMSEETMSEEVQSAQTTTQATVGVTISVIAIVSIINMSSPICIWCVVKQLQILMLLTLTGAYIPLIIKQYISGMSFALFNFDFIGLLKIPFVHAYYEWIIFEQSNDNLKDIGVEDGSTLINNILFLVLFLLFIIAHLPIAIVYLFTKSKAGKCNKVFNIAYRFMTFTIYIRLIIENFQNLALSSMSEVYGFKFSSKNRLFSLSIAWLFIIFSILFYIFIVYQFWQTKASHKRVSYAYSKELFSGLKRTNKARAYTMIMISRQLFLCCFLIFLQDLHFMVNVIIFAIIQVLFFVMIIAIRPFDQVLNNIVETLNELLLTGLVSILLYYNKSTRWNATVEKAFIYSITLNNCIVCLVMVIWMIISIVLRYIKKKSAKTEVKRYACNETKLNIARPEEERHQKDLSDVKFDHYRNSALSKIENPSRIKSDLAIKPLD